MTTTTIRRRYHLSAPGVIYMVITSLMGVGAINGQNNLLFLLFGMALGAMCVSGVISGRMMMGLSVERRPVAPAAVGQPMTIDYLLHTTGRYSPAFAVSIVELDGADSATLGPVRAFVPFAPGRSRTPARAVVQTRARGAVRLDRVALITSFPFGLIRKSVEISLPAEALVRPRADAVPWRELEHARTHRPQERESRRNSGTGWEFFGLREYRAGDPLRTIAWRASARTDSLRVRQTAAPRARRVVIDLALSADDDPDAQELAIAHAAGVAATLLRRQVATGLRIGGAALDIRPAAGARQLPLLLDTLARLDLRALGTHRGGPPVSQDTDTVRIDAASAAHLRRAADEPAPTRQAAPA